MPPFLAKLTHFILLVLLYLVQGTLVALNITRIFLMLKVNFNLNIWSRARNSFKDTMIDRHSFLQPTEFNQLDHERHFKLVFQKLFLATLSYALSALTLSHLTGEGKQIQSEKELSLFLWFRGSSFCRPGFGSCWNSRHDLLPCHIFKPHRPSHDRLRDLCSVLSTWLPVNINQLQCVHHNHNQHSSLFDAQHIDGSDSIFRNHN